MGTHTYILILLITLIFQPKKAYSIKTEYIWTKQPKGKSICLEVDKESHGTKYSQKVSNNFCKPNKTLYSFSLKLGHCFEVDEETNGTQYSNRVKPENCKPMHTEFQIKKISKLPHCYEVDFKTKGMLYYKKVDYKNCVNPSQEFFWKPKNKVSGDCFIKAEKELYLKVATEKCRPDKIVYIFQRLSPTRGVCYEQDSRDSKFYSQTISTQKCRTNNTEFFFIKKKDSIQGACYEIDGPSRGEKYLKKVSLKECKNN